MRRAVGLRAFGPVAQAIDAALLDCFITEQLTAEDAVVHVQQIDVRVGPVDIEAVDLSQPGAHGLLDLIER